MTTIAKSTTIGSAIIAAAISLTPLTAFSQDGPVCGPRSAILSELSITFDEHPLLIGQVKDDQILEVFSSKDGATFTILISGAVRSCVAITGTDMFPTTRDPGPRS